VNPATIPEQREAMFRRMKKFLGVSDAALDEIRRLFATQKWMGQGNPKPTEHPMSRAECLKIRETARLVPGDEARCGAKNMVPIYNRKAGETAEQARACIDQYEFPNIACDYPVTWVPAHVAHQLCKAQGKRMCDAHEWEGACAGAVLPAAEEYSWSARPGEEIDSRRLAFQYNHNTTREITWAYGPTKDHSKCASNSRKSDGCVTPTWERCGTNTYPAGAFPECVSPFGVYDLHGNAAEHMNLPMQEGELASRGDELGQTEMKGSWFIFNRWEAHIDDCRWRAPSWHGGRVMSEGSHMNYHLGFRCCKDLPAK
jgi:formylglycine-generating enzyme required for sulfatase activity